MKSLSSETTRIARSKPIAGAIRDVSWALASPAEMTTTSAPAPFSFKSSAASTAISSNGFHAHLHVCKIGARAIRLHIIVKHPFDRHQNLHALLLNIITSNAHPTWRRWLPCTAPDLVMRAIAQRAGRCDCKTHRPAHDITAVPRSLLSTQIVCPRLSISQ